MRASTRWRSLVRARLGEMERLAPGRGAAGPGYWDAPGRARRYDAVVAGSGRTDPLVARLREAAAPDATVLDVGAGTGRIAVAVAPAVAEVVAVDPSRAMLGILRREVRRQGLANVRCVEGPWPDLAPGGAAGAGAVAPADVVVCSFVLPLIEDAARFVAGLDAACRGRAFVYMSAVSADALVDPFWRHFHGRVRRPAPTYLDAADLMRDLGLAPQVEIVEVPSMARFRTLAAAVKSYRENLVLPDTPEVRRELRSLLADWLVAEGGGWRPPVSSLPAAILSWAGRAG